MNSPVTLVIAQLTPAVEEALTRLLQALAPADVELGNGPQGVPRDPGTHMLNEVWLSDGLLYECADAVGISRNLASRAVQQVRVAIVHSVKSTPRGKLLAPEFASARLSGGTTGSVNAADFVALMTNDRVRKSLCDNSDREHAFGPRSSAAAKAIAEYLGGIYPA
jgi:hypothetical protein